MDIKRIKKHDANTFLSLYHYLGNAPVSPLYLGCFENNKLTGVIVFGFLASPKTPLSVWSKGSNMNTWELRRLSSISETKNIESMMISSCMAFIRKEYPNIKVIMSYADEAYGHCGKIYQASNFLYVGVRETKTIFRGELHGRTLNRWRIKRNPKAVLSNKKEEMIRGRKHLYVYIIPKGVDRKHIMKNLTFVPKPYPKSGATSITKSKKGTTTIQRFSGKSVGGNTDSFQEPGEGSTPSSRIV